MPGYDILVGVGVLLWIVALVAERRKGRKARHARDIRIIDEIRD